MQERMNVKPVDQRQGEDCCCSNIIIYVTFMLIADFSHGVRFYFISIKNL